MNTLVKAVWFKNETSVDDLLFYSVGAIFFTMPLGTSLPTIFSILTASVWLFSGRIVRVKKIYRNSWFFPVILLIIIPWIGLLYTPDLKGLGINYARKTHYWIYGIALASVSFHLVDSEKWIQFFLIGLAGNAVVGLCQLIGIVPPIEGWYCGIGRGYSTLSAYLIIGILTASFYFKTTDNRRIRICSVVLMSLFFLHLVILEGRTGYVTFFVLSPMIFMNCFKKLNIPKFIGCCVVLTGLMLLSPIVRERITRTIDEIKYHINADESRSWGKVYSDKQDRFFMWYNSVHIFLDNPLIGIGTGGYKTEVSRRGNYKVPDISHPHNDLLYMAVSYGIIGMAAFFWLFAEILKNSWRQKQSVIGYFVFATGIVILISGVFNGQTIDAGTALLLSLSAGFQQSFPEFDKRMQNE